MSIYNLGSINIDHLYRLPHLVTSGETLAAESYQIGLGGKGANQSIALVLAGAEVFQIGALNRSDTIWLEQLADKGVDTRYIHLLDAPTGHAIVMLDVKSAENQIVIYPGCNQLITQLQIDQALEGAKPDDWALTQNETVLEEYFFTQAKQKGLMCSYSAAPFDPERVAKLLPMTDLLVVNEVEAEALSKTLGVSTEHLEIDHLVITLGSRGARYQGIDGNWQLPAPPVEAIDSTGAGDTFLGFMLAALSQKKPMREAMELAIAASALQVTRLGTAAAIPTLDEVKQSIIQRQS